MPIKMQYPVVLHKDTKCPQCNTSINELGGNVYVCTTGHVIEGVLLVTLRPRRKQDPVSVRVEDGTTPITPAYDKRDVLRDKGGDFLNTPAEEKDGLERDPDGWVKQKVKPQ